MLWRRVNRGLSAGRVQSPSIRLIVERERERIAFVTAGYWDIELTHGDVAVVHRRRSSPSTARKVATGKDFDAVGTRRGQGRRARRGPRPRPRRRPRGRRLHASARSRRSRTASRPKAPFMTSTLQQEGGRKLRLVVVAGDARRPGPVRAGLHHLHAHRQRRAVRRGAAGGPRRGRQRVRRSSSCRRSRKQYTSKSQERPGGPRGDPPDHAAALARTRSPASSTARSSSLYRMIWQRTLASQMADATGTTVTRAARRARRGRRRPTAEFAAVGTTITFPGYRQVYVESRDDERRPTARREALLPPLAVGDDVAVASLTPQGHATSPPARYTEASLVKRLEELGIGRPSTWASIIQTVQDRGYVWKKGQALVPTWTAFAVVGLMEQHFDELVDYDFTARIERTSTPSPRGERQKDQWLQSFYFGDDAPARAEAAGRGEPRRDRRRGDQHVPDRPRPRRRRDRRQARQVRARTSSAARTPPACPTT